MRLSEGTVDRSRAGRTRPPTCIFLLSILFTLPSVADDQPLPADADRVIGILRAAPDDPSRLEAVARWAESHGGLTNLATSLAHRAQREQKAVDLSLAASLLERAGQIADAVETHEAALTIDPQLQRSRDAAIRLWARAGWAERAIEWIDEKTELSEECAIRLGATGALSGVDAAKTRWIESLAPISEKRDLARSLGWFDLAAQLAEASGDFDLACELAIEGGDLDSALTLLQQGAKPGVESRLILARITADPSILEPALQNESPQKTARWRSALDRSLGRSIDDSDAASVEEQLSPSPSGDRLPGQTLPARRAEAEAILSGEAPPDASAGLKEAGPPSLAVAVAWLTLGDLDAARREVARWRLDPQPGEARWKNSLLRSHPEWLGLASSPDRLLRKLEVTTDRSAIELASLHRAIGEIPPGSVEEAALLFHRDRLFESGDFARAASIAPGLLVSIPLPNGDQLLRPLPESGSAFEPLQKLGPSRSTPQGVIDRAIGIGPRGPIHWGTRVPPPAISQMGQISSWSVADEFPTVQFEKEIEALGNPGIHPVAPIDEIIEVEKGWWIVIGHGLALHSSKNRLVFAWKTEERLDRNALPNELLGALSENLRQLLGELRSEPLSSIEHPAIADAWSRIVLRQGLSPSTKPAIVRALNEDAESPWVVHGGGLRVLLELNPITPASLPPSPELFEVKSIPGLETWWQRRGEIGSRDGAPSDVAPPQEPLLTVHRTDVPPARRSNPTVEPMVSPTNADSSAGNAAVRLDSATSVIAQSDGWICALTDGVPQWWWRTPPPLPGTGGWYLQTRDTPPQGRRGPDQTGPISDGGLLRLRRLDQDHVAICTDRVIVVNRQRPLPPPVGLAGENWTAIQDVGWHRDDQEPVSSPPTIWVLPTPGNRVIGEEKILGLEREGGFDLEVTHNRLAVLGYDPIEVRLWLITFDLDKGTRNPQLPLPTELTVEEDRAHQRPVALGVWGDRWLLAARGQVWIETNTGRWRPLLPERQASPVLPEHAWQAAPVVVGDRLLIGWPWGEVEEYRVP